MHWHVPNEEELKLVDRFLEEFLEPELIRLRAFMNGESLERYYYIASYIEITLHMYIIQSPLLNLLYII